jgi:hypothetical protein
MESVSRKLATYFSISERVREAATLQSVVYSPVSRIAFDRVHFWEELCTHVRASEKAQCMATEQQQESGAYKKTSILFPCSVSHFRYMIFIWRLSEQCCIYLENCIWILVLAACCTSHSGLEKREYGRGDPSHWPRYTIYPQKLALTSPTSGGRSVAIVRSLTKVTDFVFFFACLLHIVIVNVTESTFVSLSA